MDTRQDSWRDGLLHCELASGKVSRTGGAGCFSGLFCAPNMTAQASTGIKLPYAYLQRTRL